MQTRICTKRENQKRKQQQRERKKRCPIRALITLIFVFIFRQQLQVRSSSISLALQIQLLQGQNNYPVTEQSMREQFTHACTVTSRVTGLNQWPGWAAGSSPAHMGWVRPGPKKAGKFLQKKLFQKNLWFSHIYIEIGYGDWLRRGKILTPQIRPT